MSYRNYILNKHDAKISGLHWDFKIAIPNLYLLALFAIPEARVPESVGEHIQCIRLSNLGKYWLNIENMTIPDGEYGAGKITTISKGICKIEKFKFDSIVFNIQSNIKESFNGRYKLKYNKYHKRNDIWILIKT